MSHQRQIHVVLTKIVQGLKEETGYVNVIKSKSGFEDS